MEPLSTPDPAKQTRQQREENLFAAAAKLPPSERAAFLERACEGGVPLRPRLSALLAAHGEEDALPFTPLESSGITPRVEPVEEFVGRMVGRYKLLEKIGEGGCGVV